MILESYSYDWRTDLIVGALSAAIAFTGGALEVFPGWVTAGQGMVAGAFLTMAAIGIVGRNAWYMNEVIPDEDV